MQVERGERSFAKGDRVMFLRNDRELGVKNGSLGKTAIGQRATYGRDARRWPQHRIRHQELCPYRPRLRRDHPQIARRNRGPRLCSRNTGDGPAQQLCCAVAPPRRVCSSIMAGMISPMQANWRAYCRANAARIWRRIIPESAKLIRHRICRTARNSFRMAARTLGGNMWSGEEQLLQAADPDRWQDVLTGSQIMHDNREKIGECRKAKSGANEKARCSIRVNPDRTGS